MSFRQRWLEPSYLLLEIKSPKRPKDNNVLSLIITNLPEVSPGTPNGKALMTVRTLLSGAWLWRIL